MFYTVKAELTYKQIMYQNGKIPTVGDIEKTSGGTQVVIREILDIEANESWIKVRYIAEDVVGKERFKIVK